MKITEFKKENLNVKIYQESEEIASVAAEFVAVRLNLAIKERGAANLILGTGASQLAFIKYLQKQKIDWEKITVFHLDEYKGMPETHPASFRKYLKDRILERVRPKQVYILNGDAPDTEAEVLRYENLLKEYPVDVACIGIGENGHIAFNDPPVADFDDPKLVKVVELDEGCRKQQLGEGWFPALEDVPTHALSLTIPAIMRCKTISCLVPDKRKAQAVYNALNWEITTECPATILRKHSDAVLFLDSGSSLKLTV
ncbi:MAG: glucosamine-6-phosphate deaminase [Bacteroidales bacterium]|nr:glucosamine-6-phosphate deaminase [Bacteroidales bacterium]